MSPSASPQNPEDLRTLIQNLIKLLRQLGSDDAEFEKLKKNLLSKSASQSESQTVSDISNSLGSMNISEAARASAPAEQQLPASFQELQRITEGLAATVNGLVDTVKGVAETVAGLAGEMYDLQARIGDKFDALETSLEDLGRRIGNVEDRVGKSFRG